MILNSPVPWSIDDFRSHVLDCSTERVVDLVTIALLHAAKVG